MKLTTPQQVAQHYQQDKVAKNYIDSRFADPLNTIEHQQQVRILNDIIKNRKCGRVLEFAPGPARITTELEIENGLSLDSSREMINIARERMAKARKNWTFKEYDLLHTPLSLPRECDLVFCFRFLLHFQEKEREIIYRQAFSNLRNGGYLIFEALNKKIVGPLRKILGEHRYFVYDHLYTEEELKNEVNGNGFAVVSLIPVLSHFWLQAVFSRLHWIGLKEKAKESVTYLEKFPSRQPYEWVVVAEKR